MIYAHEIPGGSRLYFGESAALKRRIEAQAAQMLSEAGFVEIVTPFFSYHQHASFEDKTPLVRLGDGENHEVSLRADSTADVVRIVTKRLGRSSENKKWFYIQPVLTFPTKEQYQIGAEIIGGRFAEVVEKAHTVLEKIEIDAVLQIANIRIPQLLHTRYGIAIETLRASNIESLLQSDYPWIQKLVAINTAEDLESLDFYPEDIRAELMRMKEAVAHLSAKENIVVSPLYYANLRYYDALIFRIFKENVVLATGGEYRIEEVEAAGFAVYTDACIEYILKKER